MKQNAVTMPPHEINTWQSPFELGWMLDIFVRQAPRCILELGSADGGTLWCWAQNCQPGAHIISVDWFHPSYPDNRDKYPQWSIDGDCFIEAIRGDTRDDLTLARVKARGPYDWLFIDAGHGINEVTSDWERYSPLVPPGGVVVFHDIAPTMRPQQVEVHLLWSNIKKGRKHMEIFENDQDDKLGIGVLFM